MKPIKIWTLIDKRGYYDSEYTNIVYDLLNGTINESTSIKGKSAKHYSIKEIENSLQGVHKWNEWRDSLKTIENNEKYLDSLFSYWANR